MKKLIQATWIGRHLDEDKLTRGLHQYKNTPSRMDGRSPAQKLYGKPIQDTQWQMQSEDAVIKLADTKTAVEQSYNQHARPLPDIIIGTKVAIQNQCTKRWDIYGTVTDIGPNRRYFVKTLNGRMLVLNRRLHTLLTYRYSHMRTHRVPMNLFEPPVRAHHQHSFRGDHHALDYQHH